MCALHMHQLCWLSGAVSLLLRWKNLHGNCTSHVTYCVQHHCITSIDTPTHWQRPITKQQRTVNNNSNTNNNNCPRKLGKRLHRHHSWHQMDSSTAYNACTSHRQKIVLSHGGLDLHLGFFVWTQVNTQMAQWSVQQFLPHVPTCTHRPYYVQNLGQ